MYSVLNENEMNKEWKQFQSLNEISKKLKSFRWRETTTTSEIHRYNFGKYIK